MSPRAFTALLALLAGLLALAGLVSLSQRDADPARELLLPELRAALNDLDQVILTGAGATVVATLRQRGGRWVVEERAGYPADVTQLRGLLLALADARLLEEKTANPALYERLGVEDVEQADAGGLRLDLLSGAARIGSVILGESPAAGQIYVRRSGESRSWLAGAEVAPGRNTSDWLEQQILHIPASRIASVTITHPDGAVLRLYKAAEDDSGFAVADIPAGRHLRWATVADGIGGVLASLALEDVAPSGDHAPDPAGTISGRFETFDGLVIESQAFRVPDGVRVTFRAGTTGAAAGEQARLREEEAAEINARLGGWIYTLPTFKTEQLARRMSDLLADEDETGDDDSA